MQHRRGDLFLTGVRRQLGFCPPQRCVPAKPGLEFVVMHVSAQVVLLCSMCGWLPRVYFLAGGTSPPALAVEVSLISSSSADITQLLSVRQRCSSSLIVERVVTLPARLSYTGRRFVSVNKPRSVPSRGTEHSDCCFVFCLKPLFVRSCLAHAAVDTRFPGAIEAHELARFPCGTLLP